MLTRNFGWTGVPVPVIGQGTWMIEGSRENEKRAVRGSRLGLDLGMTHIDTAEMYGSGRAEELVAEAIAGRRDEVFLASKVPPLQCLLPGHAAGLRAQPQAAPHRSPRSLHAALVRLPSHPGDPARDGGVGGQRPGALHRHQQLRYR